MCGGRFWAPGSICPLPQNLSVKIAWIRKLNNCPGQFSDKGVRVVSERRIFPGCARERGSVTVKFRPVFFWSSSFFFSPAPGVAYDSGPLCLRFRAFVPTIHDRDDFVRKRRFRLKATIS